MDTTSELDLNLLRVLEVLLEQGSVTQAAQILGRSQPAVSQALARLRKAVGDPLFVRQGRTLVPTPRAEQLGRAARHALAELDRALATGPGFDPATSERAFSLSAPDVLGPLLPHLLEAMSDAPGVRLEVLPRSGAGGVERADVVLDVLPSTASGVVARRLGSVHAAVLCRRSHPLHAAPWDLDAWVRWPHVLVRTPEASMSPVERTLLEAGRQRRVGLVVPSLLLVPHVVAATDLLFTGPREVLQVLAEPLGLSLLDPPLPQPAVPIAALWHERHHHDPGHRWFRDRLVAVIGPQVKSDSSI